MCFPSPTRHPSPQISLKPCREAESPELYVLYSSSTALRSEWSRCMMQHHAALTPQHSSLGRGRAHLAPALPTDYFSSCKGRFQSEHQGGSQIIQCQGNRQSLKGYRFYSGLALKNRLPQSSPLLLIHRTPDKLLRYLFSSK